MTTLKDLLSQRDSLDKQIAEMRHKARSEAIMTAKELIAEHSLTQHDLFVEAAGVKKVNTTSKIKLPTKYRDPVSGKGWSGRGKPPLWLKDKDRTTFLIT